MFEKFRSFFKLVIFFDGVIANELLNSIAPNIIINFIPITSTLTWSWANSTHLRWEWICRCGSPKCIFRHCHSLWSFLYSSDYLQPTSNILSRWAATLTRWSFMNIGWTFMRFILVEYIL